MPIGIGGKYFADLIEPFYLVDSEVPADGAQVLLQLFFRQTSMSSRASSTWVLPQALKKSLPPPKVPVPKLRTGKIIFVIFKEINLPYEVSASFSAGAARLGTSVPG